MKRMLKQKALDLVGVHAGIRGNVSGLRGDVSGIRGNVSGIRGDASGISGNIDHCGITDTERRIGINIKELIVQAVKEGN